ncbi:hypothetical protein WJX73_001134 [Symbiochloris irregularis]|uniref:Uncharacterized protein n=1 Tax=Symbiochloris irregularis TaxID=706552 RepID=A0AAW1NZP0_9CHLO
MPMSSQQGQKSLVNEQTAGIVSFRYSHSRIRHPILDLSLLRCHETAQASQLASASRAAGLVLAAPGEYVDPPVWPKQFHATFFQTVPGPKLSLLDLWYDIEAGSNLNLIQDQLGPTLWDLEWTNGTSYYFDREADTCKVVKFPVGMLPPDWLKGSAYLGKENVSSHECNVWQKGDPVPTLSLGSSQVGDPKHFITYWADVHTNLPIRWVFFTGQTLEVLKWVEGEVLPKELLQAPDSCFVDMQHDARILQTGESSNFYSGRHFADARQ